MQKVYELSSVSLSINAWTLVFIGALMVDPLTWLLQSGETEGRTQNVQVRRTRQTGLARDEQPDPLLFLFQT